MDREQHRLPPPIPLEKVKQRVPNRTWDVTWTGALTIVGAGSYVLRLLRVLQIPGFDSGAGRATVLGILRMDSLPAIAATEAGMAVVSSVAGYGLLRRRAFGWWLAVLIMPYSYVDSIVNFDACPLGTTVGIVMLPLGVLWYALRIPLLRPFGGRTGIERISGSRGMVLDMLAKTVFVTSCLGTIAAVLSLLWLGRGHGMAMGSLLLAAAANWIVAALGGLVYALLAWRHTRRRRQAPLQT